MYNYTHQIQINVCHVYHKWTKIEPYRKYVRMYMYIIYIIHVNVFWAVLYYVNMSPHLLNAGKKIISMWYGVDMKNRRIYVTE